MPESKDPSAPDPSKPSRRPARKAPADNLSLALAGQKVSVVSRETKQEQASRLRQEEARSAHDLWRDRLILRACLIAFPVLGGGCLLILFLPGQPIEARTWAISTLTGLATGIVGYAFGKSGRSTN